MGPVCLYPRESCLRITRIRYILYRRRSAERLVESTKHYIHVDRGSANIPQTAMIIWTFNSLEKEAPTF